MIKHFDASKPVLSSKLSLCVDYGGADIRLEQYGRGNRTALDRFRVVYGKQVDDDLTYGEACAKLGEAIMHHLSCEGLVDNRDRGERS